SVWSRRRRQRSGPRAMIPRSALWPSMATATTWWSSARADSTAAVTASASARGPSLQKRWRTPQPTEGTSASGMARGYRRSARPLPDGSGRGLGPGGAALDPGRDEQPDERHEDEPDGRRRGEQPEPDQHGEPGDGQ